MCRDSLLAKGVLKESFECRNRLLTPSNIDRSKLAIYAKEAALFSTGYYSRKLPHTELAKNSRGEEDFSIFDFTNLYAARNASRAIVRKGFPLLLAVVGDSLLEPFWPEGTGCARGFLSALDTAWMIRSWSLQTNPLQVIEERENLYQALVSLSAEDSSLKNSFKNFSMDPRTR